MPRNVFDGSFQNNLTMDIGGLYPVFCKEVIPGDSFKITPTFGLRFMPLVFPIQTRLQANLHFFYVRNRNLWKDWARYITNTDGALSNPDASTPIPPYIGGLDLSRYNKMFTTGSLGDYLGLPTTIAGKYGGDVALHFYGSDRSVPQYSDNDDPESMWQGPTLLADKTALLDALNVQITKAGVDGCYYEQLRGRLDLSAPAPQNCLWTIRYDSPDKYDVVASLSSSEYIEVVVSFVSSYFKDKLTYTQVLDSLFISPLDSEGRVHEAYLLKDVVDGYKQLDGTHVRFRIYKREGKITSAFGFVFYAPLNWKMYGHEEMKFFPSQEFVFVVQVDSVTMHLNTETFDVRDVPFETSPYRSQIKVSALPFRAYESIYNSFYRDVRNNPYIKDGKPEYNKYIPSDDGGEDSNTYELRYRNWEPDFLTTAVQSPQQGIAPLVGVSSTGTMKFADEDGNVYTAQAQFAADGETITGFSVNSPDMPAGNLRALVDIASSGISINDFRNVNALQRYLETNMRKGLRYKDWIKGHYDVDTSYAELDMPEFLGGVSKPVMVNQVTSTASTSTDSLGDYAGQASCMGTGNTISRFFDEHGFVIGILSISPVPNYSQLLPKFWLKNNPLDYYTPEFGHIGYQPITYSEVCPLQSVQAGDKLTDVFGYQRAWYDYIANVDEVHGEFRTTLQDFLINRYFDIRPELSEKFLLISPKDTNRPFVVRDGNNQPILGQIYFDLKMKRPIPQLGIPRLE